MVVTNLVTITLFTSGAAIVLYLVRSQVVTLFLGGEAFSRGGCQDQGVDATDHVASLLDLILHGQVGVDDVDLDPILSPPPAEQFDYDLVPDMKAVIGQIAHAFRTTGRLDERYRGDGGIESRRRIVRGDVWRVLLFGRC